MIERPNSFWALKKAATLEINAQQLDSGIEKIQKLLRLMQTKRGNVQVTDEAEVSEVCALWMFLSETYKKQGNLQTAIRVCKTVLDYRPTDFAASLQVHIFLRIFFE